MKILVLSDTHYGGSIERSDTIIDEIPKSDYIFHLGDFTSREYYEYLNSTGKLLGVRGNNDFTIPNIRVEESFEAKGYKIKLLHGHTENIEYLDYRFKDYDLILHGHIHHPYKKQYDKTIIASPGSITDNRYVNHNSYMILTLGSEIDISIKKLL